MCARGRDRSREPRPKRGSGASAVINRKRASRPAMRYRRRRCAISSIPTGVPGVVACGEVAGEIVQPPPQLADVRVGQPHPEARGADRCPRACLCQLVANRVEHGSRVRGGLRDPQHPRLAGDEVGLLQVPRRGAAHRLRLQEAELDELSHVVEGRAGVTAETERKLAVRQGLVDAQAENAEAQWMRQGARLRRCRVAFRGRHLAFRWLTLLH